MISRTMILPVAAILASTLAASPSFAINAPFKYDRCTVKFTHWEKGEEKTKERKRFKNVIVDGSVAGMLTVTLNNKWGPLDASINQIDDRTGEIESGPYDKAFVRTNLEIFGYTDKIRFKRINAQGMRTIFGNSFDESEDKLIWKGKYRIKTGPHAGMSYHFRQSFSCNARGQRQ